MWECGGEQDEDYLMSTLRYRTLGLSSLGLGLQAR